MAVDESKYPTAHINPFMDVLYEWGHAEGLWEDKRELLEILDRQGRPPESLKSFLIENDIPEWYYKNGWRMSIGAGHYPQIIKAWVQGAPYGHYFGENNPKVDANQKIGDIKVALDWWGANVQSVAIRRENDPIADIWWYNPIIFTPTPGKSWFGDGKVRSNFYSLNWKENPFDSIK